jgi:hypothetical protein
MKVNKWLWIRVACMSVGFVGAVHVIRTYNQFGPGKTFATTSVNLCPTRVKEISIVNGMSLVQDKMAWYRKHNGQLEELDPIAVEKWFGRHCVVAADPAETPTGSGEQVATIGFITGSPQILFTTNAGIFTWMNQPFTSLELQEALKALPELPIRLRPSR